MKIAVFGATGMAGSAIVSEALARKHHVIAASRRPTTRKAEGLSVRAIDVADSKAVDAVLTEVDTAVLAIRFAPGKENLLAPRTRGVLDAAARYQKRLLIVGGSAPLRSPNYPDRLLIDDPSHVRPEWKAIAQASLEQFQVCQDHPYSGWVYLSPPAVFEPGDCNGSYQRGTTTLLTDTNGLSRITPPDLVAAVLDELEHPGDEQHFTVAHGDNRKHQPCPKNPAGSLSHKTLKLIRPVVTIAITMDNYRCRLVGLL